MRGSTIQLECDVPWGLVLLVGLIASLALLKAVCRCMCGSKQAQLQQPVLLTDVGGGGTQQTLYK